MIPLKSLDKNLTFTKRIKILFITNPIHWEGKYVVVFKLQFYHFQRPKLSLMTTD